MSKECLTEEERETNRQKLKKRHKEREERFRKAGFEPVSEEQKAWNRLIWDLYR